MSDTTPCSTSIQVMARMFTLLDTLAQEGAAVSLKIVSERTGLHPSTAHRILNDLAAGGFVERSGPGTYRLGLRLLQLGNLVKARLDVRELAARPMQDLHRLTGQSVALYVRQDDEALCVERTSKERNGVQVNRIAGARSPLTASAAGKVLLTALSSAQLAGLIPADGSRLELLQTELAALRAAGIAIDSDQAETSHRQAAAPIHDDLGHVVASLALDTLSQRLAPETAEAIKSTAARVSTALGWTSR